MKHLLKSIVATTLLIPLLATASITFKEGKDYELVPPSSTKVAAKTNTIEVIEFFNYGCPGCYAIEPSVQKWVKTKPANVTFRRVPVVFNKHWEPLAKAYYVADAFDVTDKVTPALFKAIHDDQKNISSESALTEVFVEQGVKEKDFKSAYNFSPGIDAQIIKDEDLMREYQVFVVPSIVIAGKYKTNASMVGGNPQKLFDVVNYLVKKETP